MAGTPGLGLHDLGLGLGPPRWGLVGWRRRGCGGAGRHRLLGCHVLTVFQQQAAAAVHELEPCSVVGMESSTPCGMFGAVDMLVTRPGQTLPPATRVVPRSSRSRGLRAFILGAINIRQELASTYI